MIRSCATGPQVKLVAPTLAGRSSSIVVTSGGSNAPTDDLERNAMAAAALGMRSLVWLTDESKKEQEKNPPTLR
jgi:hypothetical protein